ncbi:related to ubiquitin-like protein modifier [Phialocephala subalpina]|uniref:Related to ubiquitin-like protein modifier n=1 Tax=Phialocephala subalpina TaxID=576137 RepID=A0A1L7WJH5_9HELO|nr:related to ubiquitin-like protein modifier [Phialocephala subalpina]
MSASDENDRPGTPKEPEGQPVSEHLNIKVTDNNNEVFFKIKRTTILKKLMDAFCETWQGSQLSPLLLDMQDGDTLEVHQEQIGGAN